jgi:hypothetical protein
VARSFETFEELADGQVLSLIDNAFRAIADLDIRVAPDGRTPTRIDDMQIYRDGNASFRIPPPAGANGVPG